MTPDLYSLIAFTYHYAYGPYGGVTRNLMRHSITKDRTVSKKTAIHKAAPMSPFFLVLPDAVEKKVPLSQLVFDRRLQHRKHLFDEATVGVATSKDGGATGYCAQYEMGSEFPAILAVHQTADENGEKCSIYWVYDGFQRGETYKRVGAEKVVCKVIEGATYSDALFLSLKSNSTNSALARTAGDVRASINVLLDNPEAIGLVTAKAAGNNAPGLHRLIAAAVGCGVSTVMDALTARGQMVRGRKIVAKPVPEPVPVAGSESADAEHPVTDPVPGGDTGDQQDKQNSAAVPTEEQRKAANDVAYAAMKEMVFADRIKECGRLSKRLAVLLASMYTDPVRSEIVRTALERNGMAIDSEFDVRAVQDPTGFSPHYEILEHWPVVVRLGQLFADIRMLHEGSSLDPVVMHEPEPTENGHSNNGKRKQLSRKR